MNEWLAEYHRRGWALTQLHGVDEAGRCTCGRTDEQHRKQAGKHPTSMSWQSSGLASWAEIENAWHVFDRANVGVLTGRPSGLWVLDIDPENGGDKALALLEATNGPLPPTYEVKTGSGGRHLYWLMPLDGSDVTNARGVLPAGIDVRGSGGQVVAPPSRTAKGDYLVAVNGPMLPAPDWLLRAIRAQRERVAAPTFDASGYVATAADSSRLRAYVSAAVQRALTPVREAPQGTRNDTAFTAACALHEFVNSPWAGLPTEVAWAAFWNACTGALDPLPQSEVEDLWLKGERRVAGRGREYPTVDGPGEFLAPVYPQPQLSYPQSYPQPQVIEGQLVADVAPREVEGDPVDALIARMLTADQMDELPDPEPLVEGFLFLDSLAWIIGRPGEGKSFVALDLALCVATGRPWHGAEVRQGGVVYIAAEGAAGLKRRRQAWQRYAGMSNEALGAFRVLPLPVQAADRAAWAVLIEAVRRLQPSLVVIDTQARVTVGMEENSNTEMGEFVNAAEWLRTAASACVAVVHHMNAQGQSRGASALLGAATSELSVSKADDRVTVKTTKQKDVVEQAPVELRLEPIPAADSATLVPVDKVTAGSLESYATKVEREETARSMALQLLASVMRDAFAEGRGGTKAEVGAVWRADAARLGAVASDAPSTVKRAFHRTWNKALEKGMLVRVVGTSSFRWHSDVTVD